MGNRLGVVDLRRQKRLPGAQRFGDRILLPDVGQEAVEPFDEGFDAR